MYVRTPSYQPVSLPLVRRGNRSLCCRECYHGESNSHVTRVPNYHREFNVGENPCKPQHYAPRPAHWDESAGDDDKVDVGDGLMRT